MHSAVIKAQKIARIAKEHDWHGNIDSSMDGNLRLTFLYANRNDEKIMVVWQDKMMTGAKHSIFNRMTQLACAKHVLKVATGWPDVVDLLRWFPDMNPVELVEKYRKLPFDWQNDSNEDILNCLSGRHIWWYSHITRRIHNEFVMIPRKKSQVFYIKEIGHRKMFNFTAQEFGMRSVMLDTLLKVQ